jgi:thioredoxin reductase
MQFWQKIAEAGGERYLKSYCFGTNLSTPTPGFSFADHNSPRGLETFEPCSMRNFTNYGQWFQQNNVPWVEPIDVLHVGKDGDGFVVTLVNGERCLADHVVVATGLAYFAHVPRVMAALPSELAIHTSRINSFASFKGTSVAIIGAGQSALEAAALLHEAGAQPQLLVRDETILWHHRVSRERSLWRRLRSPISGLGTGPTAWTLTHFPGAVHRVPTSLRTRFVKSHLPAEGAWWLRSRVENLVPVHFNTTVVHAGEAGGRAVLQLHDAKSGTNREIKVDHVVAGSGFDIDVDRLDFLDAKLRSSIQRLERTPRLNANFEASVPGLRFIGPTSAMSFGPLFRFVVGADYTARVVSANLAAQVAAPMQSRVSSAA